MMWTSEAGIPVVGAGAVSAVGCSWRGLADAQPNLTPATQLAVTHPETPAAEVGPLPPELVAGDARGRRLMSRASVLAAAALRAALEDAGWRDGRETTGLYLGLGAAGGPLEELRAMMRESVVEGRLSLSAFATRGLAAANPLFAFHLLDNFSLCHGAILEGLCGPNAAFFSRGGGTVTALIEGLQALCEGDCSRALAGGADTALYPGTWMELKREGWAAAGLVPGEGAAWLALETSAGRPLARIDRCLLVPPRLAGMGSALAEVRPLVAAGVDAVVISPWGAPSRDALEEWGRVDVAGASVVDASRLFGEALAASAALGWALALDLVARGASCVLALVAGIDGELGAVRFRSAGGAR